MTNAILGPLLQSPLLPRHMRRLEETLADEARRRRDFIDDLTEDDSQEFINGEVVTHSPVRAAHNRCTVRVTSLLSAHCVARELGMVGVEKLMVSLTRNDYEPDVCFYGAESSREFTPDQIRFPAPDLVVEVLSESTEAVDRGVKFEDYAAHGVTEYWIVDPDTEVVEQYVLAGEEYTLRMKSGTGELASVAVAGFVIPVRALFEDAEHHACLIGLLA